MKTGITRRIDNLGRIVLPKEIRNNLKIKTGEMLEITIKDNETIVLKKYNTYQNEERYLKHYVALLSNQLNCKIYLTDLSKIIVSSEPSLEGKSLSDKLSKLLTSSEKTNDFQDIPLTSDIYLKEKYKIYYLCPNADIIGSIIFQYNEEPTIENVRFSKMSSDFIEDLMEN